MRILNVQCVSSFSNISKWIGAKKLNMYGSCRRESRCALGHWCKTKFDGGSVAWNCMVQFRIALVWKNAVVRNTTMACRIIRYQTSVYYVRYKRWWTHNKTECLFLHEVATTLGVARSVIETWSETMLNAHLDEVFLSILRVLLTKSLTHILEIQQHAVRSQRPCKYYHTAVFEAVPIQTTWSITYTG